MTVGPGFFSLTGRDQGAGKSVASETNIDDAAGAAHGAGEGHSPLAQFEIRELVPIHFGDWNLSFTNSALWMMVAIALATMLFTLSMRRHALVPGRWQSVAELGYEFVANMVRDNVGQIGRPYFPFIFTLFIFILFGNMIGMVPYTFTYTSHIIVTFGMALVVFVGVTIIGFVRHGTRFLKFFVPSGVPAPLLAILVPIEVLSYFVRPVSLSLRLFANMMAGHTMLKVFGGFVVALGLFGFMPLALIVALTGLEIGIAFLQAYVFAVLSCLYLNDALHMHH